MYKILETKVITDRMTGGFCAEGESVRFILEVYKSSAGQLEGFVSYFDNFEMKLSFPPLFEGREIGRVNKTIEVSEEYLTSYPTPLVSDDLNELLEKFHERLRAHHFVLLTEATE